MVYYRGLVVSWTLLIIITKLVEQDYVANAYSIRRNPATRCFVKPHQQQNNINKYTTTIRRHQTYQNRPTTGSENKPLVGFYRPSISSNVDPNNRMSIISFALSSVQETKESSGSNNTDTRVVVDASKSLKGPATTKQFSTSTTLINNNGESIATKSTSPKPPPSSSTQIQSFSSPPGSKLRRLKDTMWVREALEDLAAAEFALNVEASGTAPVGKKRKRAVDYEKLLTQLDRRIKDMGCDTFTTVTDAKQNNNITLDVTCVLTPGQGMGSLTYNDKQRSSLLHRTYQTRQALIETIRSFDEEMKQVADRLDNELPFKIKLPELPELPEIRVEIPKEKSSSTSDDNVGVGPKLYVRDDGTVDWDGALQDQAALRKFGKAVWARINGQETSDASSIDDDNSMKSDQSVPNNNNHEKGDVTAKIEETPEIVEAREKLDELSIALRNLERNHIKLLNSAILEGEATANVKLAAIDPELRNKIRQSADDVKIMKEKVSFQTLIYELERIYTYLMGEVGNPNMNGYIPLQDRLNVAEFGLLESQIDTLRFQLETNDMIVDEDVLMVVYDQLTDFKRRLGIDYYVAGLTFDQEAIKRWLGELLNQTKKGLAFYIKGCQLFWNDLLFCLRLINRAIQGYTLKPREVRTLRRTFKDIITFIPFVIILLIPLSPIGHVLVFGAIQRFFPDFFPSCFTEQRQNLLQLYENTEYSKITINETMNEKLARLTASLFFAMANAFKSLFIKLQERMIQVGESSDDDSADIKPKKNV